MSNVSYHNEEYGSNELMIMPQNAGRLYKNGLNVVFVFAITANILLTCVLLTERNAFLSVFSRAFLQNCVCDLFYASITFTTKIQYEMFDGDLAILINGFYVGLPMNWHYFAIATVTFTMYMSVLIIPILFYFRYCLVVKRKELTARQLAQFALIPIAASTCIMTFLTGAFVADRRSNNDAQCRALFSQAFWNAEERQFSKCLLTRINSPLSLSFFFSITVIPYIATHVAMYGMTTYFSVVVYRALRSARDKLTGHSAKLQSQITTLLIVQLLMPIFCACFPLSVSIFVSRSGVRVRGTGLIVIFAMALIPLISPCTIIFLVSSYRRRCALLILAPFGAFYETVRKAKIGIRSSVTDMRINAT